MRMLVTGGAGFIGSHFVDLLISSNYEVAVLDDLTYAGNLSNLSNVLPIIRFFKGKIQDRKFVQHVFNEFRPAALINFAAESHVDRSILSPYPFFDTNVLGTLVLLEESKRYLESRAHDCKKEFRFLQVSTDEVFGDLRLDDAPVNECSPYRPSSPYAASKAAADHVVRSWFRTYGLPTVLVHGCNNFGPRQFREKFLPVVICNLLERKKVPLFGDGLASREWIYVADFCEGVLLALLRGRPGESYCLGTGIEKQNIEILRVLCRLILRNHYDEVVDYIADRPGHDRRYCMSSVKAMAELGFQPTSYFPKMLEETIAWYRANGRQGS